MKDDPSRLIADTILYDGQLSRRAYHAERNRTIGRVVPEAYRRYCERDAPSRTQTECVVEGTGVSRVDVHVRFLQLVRRAVFRPACNRQVAQITVGRKRDPVNDEAIEREASISDSLDALTRHRRSRIRIHAGRHVEPLEDPSGAIEGYARRSWCSLTGELEVVAERRNSGLFLLRATVVNDTRWAGEDEEEALERSFVAAHTVLRVDGGSFVSLLDPPRRFQEAAEACRNVHTWPVLVGEPGDRGQMLSSPFILCDYPSFGLESRSTSPATAEEVWTSTSEPHPVFDGRSRIRRVSSQSQYAARG